MVLFEFCSFAYEQTMSRSDVYSSLFDLQVGSRYLDHLIVERKYAEAASLCPKLLQGSASAWERYYRTYLHMHAVA